MYRIFGDVNSGNCYKVKLLATQLGVPFEWVNVDILQQETRSAGFLRMNPNGKIPLLEMPDGRYLSESNAILHFLAEDTPLLPDDRYERAKVLQWLFFEQYSHEPYIATARYIVRYLGRPAEREAEFQSKQAPGNRALDVMEEHLRHEPFFVGNRYTIADIALFAYTHVAEEGGFSLKAYPCIQQWLGRVALQPRFIKLG